MNLSTLNLSIEPVEPAHTIKNYLKIDLNKQHPYIYIEDGKLKAISVQNYREKDQKTIDQFALFTKLIEELRLLKSIISIDLKRIGAQALNTSSSGDSRKEASQKNPEDEFLIHSIKIGKISEEDRLFSRTLKMVLAIAKESIFTLAKRNPAMEKFYKNDFINGLECHRDLYFAETYNCPLNISSSVIPNITNSLSLQNSIFVTENRIKKLSDDAIYQLIHYWLNSDKNSIFDSKLSIEPPEELKKYTFTLSDEDQKLILDNQLFKFSTAAKIYQECVIRKLVNPSQDTFCEDIDRHLPCIKIKTENYNIFYYVKKDVSKKSNKSQNEIDNYIIFFESTLNQLSANSDLIKKIIDKYKNYAKESVKSNLNISAACIDFIEHLQKTDKDVEESELSKKLYYILCTLTQQTYALPAGFIKPMLGSLSVIFEKGENSRFFDYEFINDNVTLTVSINASTKECGGVNFQTVNTLKSKISNLKSWSSEISIKIQPHNKNKDEIRKRIINPLENLGFKVIV